MSNYTPDRWEIVKITNSKGESHHRVFASWAGGYVSNDGWQISSGIERVEINEVLDEYSVFNASGSYYNLRRYAQGTTGYTAGVLALHAEKLEKNGAKLEVVTIQEVLDLYGRED